MRQRLSSPPPQTPSLVRTTLSCAVCSLGLMGHPALPGSGLGCAVVLRVSLGRRRLLDPVWQKVGRGGGCDPIPNRVSSGAFFVLKLSKTASLAEFNPRVPVEQLLYFRNQPNRRNDEQTFLSRPCLVLSRLFCSHGSGSVFSLQSPWSPLVSEAGTALLLREPGQRLSLLGLARVLGLGGETAALKVREGDPWELSRASATHRVLPGSARQAVCRRHLGPWTRWHSVPVPEGICCGASHGLLSGRPTFPLATLSSAGCGWSGGWRQTWVAGATAGSADPCRVRRTELDAVDTAVCVSAPASLHSPP